MIGTTVGGYKIVSKLSTGGMGTIYRAEHALIGKAAAVKVLHPELSHNTEIVNRFFNEAKATTSIKHPGIVEVFDFGYLESGDAYLTMEFLEGCNLASWIEQRGKLDEGEAAMVLRSVCNALAVAHTKGIVHRDLKPDNIFMVPDPESALGERPKILDFGIAKLNDIGAATTATRTGAVMGTPTYMSPEQCKGAGVVDHRADLYSLGCILYELVCGKPPFTDMGAGEMIGAHLFMTPARPRELSPTLSEAAEALIMALLDKDPSKRPQTAKELAARLTELAQQHHWVTTGAPEGVTAPALVPLVRPTPLPSGLVARVSAQSIDAATPVPGRASSPVLDRPTPFPGRASSPAVEPTTTATDASDGESTPPKPTTLSGAASQSFDVPPRSRRGLAIAAAAGALLIGGIVAFAVVSSGGSSPRAAAEGAPAMNSAASGGTDEATPSTGSNATGSHAAGVNAAGATETGANVAGTTEMGSTESGSNVTASGSSTTASGSNARGSGSGDAATTATAAGESGSNAAAKPTASVAKPTTTKKPGRPTKTSKPTSATKPTKPTKPTSPTKPDASKPKKPTLIETDL